MNQVFEKEKTELIQSLHILKYVVRVTLETDIYTNLGKTCSEY